MGRTFVSMTQVDTAIATQRTHPGGRPPVAWYLVAQAGGPLALEIRAAYFNGILKDKPVKAAKALLKRARVPLARLARTPHLDKMGQVFYLNQGNLILALSPTGQRITLFKRVGR